MLTYEDFIKDPRFKEASPDDRKQFRSNYFEKYVSSKDPAKLAELHKRADEVEKEVYGEQKTPEGKLLSGMPSKEQEYEYNSESVEHLKKFNQNLVDNAAAGVEAGMIPKAAAFVVGREGTLNPKIETPNYDLKDIISGNDLGSMTAREAFATDMAYYTANTLTDIIPITKIATGVKALQGAKFINKLPFKNAVNSAGSFGAYSGLNRSLDFMAGKEGTENVENPVLDVAKSTGQGMAMGWATSLAKPLSKIAMNVTGLLPETAGVVAKGAIKRVPKGDVFVTKAEQIGANVKDKISKAATIGGTNVLTKSKDALATGATILAEDYAMLGTQNVFNGKNFTDVTQKDMMQNSPFSFGFHAANTANQKPSVSIREAMDQVNVGKTDAMKDIRETQASNEHSNKFGVKTAEQIYEMSKVEKDGKVNYEQTMKNIVDNVQYISKHSMDKIYADGAAKNAFDAKINSYFSGKNHGGKFRENKSYKSATELNDAIKGNLRNKALDLKNLRAEIDRLEVKKNEYMNTVNENVGYGYVKDVAYYGAVKDLVNTKKTIDLLNNQLQKMQSQYDVFKDKQGSKVKEIKEAQKVYENYNKSIDYNENLRKVEKLNKTNDPMETGKVSELYSMTDNGMKKIAKEANYAPVKDPKTWVGELGKEAYDWLANPSRTIHNKLGAKFADAVISPLRVVEATKAREDVADRDELLVWADKLSKENRIKVGLYMAARQGGSALETVRNMVNSGNIKTGLISKYKGYIPTRKEMVNTKLKDGSGSLHDFVDYIDNKMEGYWDRLMTARDLMGLEGLEGVKDYFTLIRNVEMMRHYDLDFMLKGQKWESALDSIEGKKYNEEMAAKNRHFEERVNSLKDIELDPLVVMSIYGQAARKTIHLAPASLKVEQIGSELAKTQNEAGQMVREMAMRFNGALDSKISSEWKALGHKVYSNLINSVLGWRMSTVISQVTSLSNTMSKYGVLPTIEAATEIMKDPELRKRAMEMSMHLQVRSMDINFNSKKHFSDGIGNKALAVWEDLSFKPLKCVDLAVAQVTWAAAYRDAKMNQMLSERDARTYADEQVVSLQGSASALDRSRLQSTFLGKMLTPFQTFTINQWNFVMADIFGLEHSYKYQATLKDGLSADNYIKTLPKSKRAKMDTHYNEDGTVTVYDKQKTQNLGKAAKEFGFLLLFSYLTTQVYDEYNLKRSKMSGTAQTSMPNLNNNSPDPIGAMLENWNGANGAELRHGEKEPKVHENYIADAVNTVVTGSKELASFAPIVGNSPMYGGETMYGAVAQSGADIADTYKQFDANRPMTWFNAGHKLARVGLGIAGTDVGYDMIKRYNKFEKEQAKADAKAQRDADGYGSYKSYKEGYKPYKTGY